MHCNERGEISASPTHYSIIQLGLTRYILHCDVATYSNCGPLWRHMFWLRVTRGMWCYFIKCKRLPYLGWESIALIGLYLSRDHVTFFNVTRPQRACGLIIMLPILALLWLYCHTNNCQLLYINMNASVCRWINMDIYINIIFNQFVLHVWLYWHTNNFQWLSIYMAIYVYIYITLN